MPVFVRNTLVGVAFLPLLCLLVLLGAIRFRWMDSLTVAMPMGVRQAVATVILNQNKVYGDKSLPVLERVVRIDPDSAMALQRLCGMRATPIDRRMEDCRRAIAVKGTPWNYKGLARVQEEKGDWTGAEETMRVAQSKADNVDDIPALFLRELGRLEMVNGHLTKSFTDLTQAEKFDARDAEFAKNDDGEAEGNLEMDREYLVVLYDRMHDPQRSEAMCRKALPKSDKPCGCRLDEKNELKCEVWPKDDEKDD